MKRLARSQVPPRSDHLKHSKSPEEFWYLRNVDRMAPASRAVLMDAGSWPSPEPGQILQTQLPDWHLWPQAPSSLQVEVQATLLTQAPGSWVHQVHPSGSKNLAGPQGPRHHAGPCGP